jgi:hypothetical protein
MTGIRTSRGELTFETERIEVTSNLPRPAKSWRYTDAAGHEHYWQDGYPTLVTVVDSVVEPYWCEDCQEHHDEGDEGAWHLECPQCHEEIRPGLTGPSLFREFAPGRTSWWLDGQPIDEATARRLYDEARGVGEVA